MITFNAMNKRWIGRLAAVRLTFRRLPSVASGQYYENVLNRTGYTLAVPCFGPKNGVHLTLPFKFSLAFKGSLAGFGIIFYGAILAGPLEFLRGAYHLIKG